ncbi:MAG: hypothetical protein ACLQVX_17975 [Limisphaerales bacterium]
MNSRLLIPIWLLVGLTLLGPAGCGRSPAPLSPLAAEQIPAEMQRAFNNARPEVKDAIGRITAALQAKDNPAAYQEVQALCKLPGQTKPQRLLAARALLTVTGLLQASQAQGDPDAAAALKLRRLTR